MARRPFFMRFVEKQATPESEVRTDVHAGAAATTKYPSDKDELAQTMKYPSDGDEGSGVKVDI